MRRLVFDSYAVLAWLREEPAASFVDGLLRLVPTSEATAGICVINLGEVYYCMARCEGAARAEGVLTGLTEFSWAIHPVSNDAVLAAARLKARFRVSYADAFALACAQEQQAELVTGDPELLVADHGVPILWPGVGQTPEV
ncbi:MAG: type II toxin-antitoxin system VapC family toxin [Armatimonadota bacterium]